MKRLLVRDELCSGCMACEIACVAQHEGSFGTLTARMHVVKVEAEGLDQPHVCLLCEDTPCIHVCPTDALYWDENSGCVLLHQEDCISCDVCLLVCPTKVISLHPETMLALVCDLCRGDPACVKRCATGALLYAEAVEQNSEEG